jgi:hypothetical protein
MGDYKGDIIGTFIGEEFQKYLRPPPSPGHSAHSAIPASPTEVGGDRLNTNLINAQTDRGLISGGGG